MALAKVDLHTLNFYGHTKVTDSSRTDGLIRILTRRIGVQVQVSQEDSRNI